MKKRKPKKFIDSIRPNAEKPINLIFKNTLKPRSINQKKYIDLIYNNDIVFCQGLPGSGKTHIAIGTALKYLVTGQVKKIVITRPVVEAGERLGFLPGTAQEKLNPYLLPLFDEINYFVEHVNMLELRHHSKIDIVPLALMRGRSFHDSFIIADECQNASYDQLKMLLTRIGFNSKMVLTGDIDQSDLDLNKQGGFQYMIEKLQNIDGIGGCVLSDEDIVRNPIIAKIIDKLKN